MKLLSESGSKKEKRAETKTSYPKEKEKYVPRGTMLNIRSRGAPLAMTLAVVAGGAAAAAAAAALSCLAIEACAARNMEEFWSTPRSLSQYERRRTGFDPVLPLSLTTAGSRTKSVKNRTK